MKKLTTEEFVSRAKTEHGDTYIYDKSRYSGINNVVIITCRIHGDFEQKAGVHLMGCGCQRCATENFQTIMKTALAGRRITNDEFISQSRQIHGDVYDYDRTLYDGHKAHVTITCREHGDFEQLAYVHLGGSGCRLCAMEASSLTTEKFIEMAQAIHDDTYLYDRTVYTRRYNKVIITCRIHGDFEQDSQNHLKGHGCSKCVTSNKKSKIATEWLDSLGIDSDCREVAIKEFPRRPLDAFVSETNTVYQFHGDYWHGNSAIYESSCVNAHNGKTMGELYQSTIDWDQQIRDLGYNLVVMWESDWRKIRKQSTDINQIV